MIDLHCHILPGVDDGARSLEDSVAMAQKAVFEGIGHILVTPHHKNGKFINQKEDVIKATESLQTELDSRGINLTLYPGQEVRINGDLLQDIENNNILFVDEEERYVLIEFPTLSIPHYTEALFFQFGQKGITPIIVHPERNQEIIDNPDILVPFIERGALAQLTASSYVGVFGKEIEELSAKLIEANLVHILASDAHNIKGRGFHMKEAYAKIEKNFGSEMKKYFINNSKSIFNGDLVSTNPPSEVSKLQNKSWNISSLFKKRTR